MKKIYLLSAMLIASAGITAQNTVTADASAEIIGYANVFETTANGGGFVFGDSWGVADLKTVLDTDANTITLQPNYNTYGDGTDEFWVNQDTGEGNKVFEGNTFVEDGTLVGSELTFQGGVVSNDLDPSYVAIAFIKVFNADFSVLKQVDIPLVAGQNFSITYTDVEPEDTTVQYGWSVTGINANPDDEATLGSIVVTDNVLSVEDFDASSITSYPNPVTNKWNVDSQESISKVSIVNILGQQVYTDTPNATQVNVDMSHLPNGIYLATVATAQGSKTSKLVKK